jgi:predicted nucleic acid-binding protein
LSFVLDASAIVAFAYGEEMGVDLDAMYTAIKVRGAVVPQIWRLELANVLLVGCRRNRHTPADAQGILADLAALPIEVDQQTHQRAGAEILQLALKHELTSYDASYLELALRLRVPLATLDRKLMQASMREGVELFWPAIH